ncbi:hypothetical protein FQN57_000928 [Myotisia sp. PD_48]|nr:hypothetical protein FQN57_000928 [Myotisia sp. PD_48]
MATIPSLISPIARSDVIRNGDSMQEKGDIDISTRSSTDCDVVQDAADTPTQSKWSTYAVYAGLLVLFLCVTLQSAVIHSLVPYITSDFAAHSLIPVTYLLAFIVNGVILLPVSRIIDIWGRPWGLIAMASLDVLGLIIMATSRSVKTYAAAQIILEVGYGGILYILRVLVVDISPLRNRALLFGLATYPYLITPFAGPAMAQAYYETSNWRWALGTFAFILPFLAGVLLLLFVSLGNHEAVRYGGQYAMNESATKQRIRHHILDFDYPSRKKGMGGLFGHSSCWFSYFTSVLQVVYGLSIKDSGYLANTYYLGQAVISVMTGLVLKYTGRHRTIAIVGFAVKTIGTGLFIYCSQRGAAFGGFVTGQVLISTSAGILHVSLFMAGLDEKKGENAMRMALFFLSSMVGAAIGLTVATPIWRSTFLRLLEENLPTDLKSEASLIFSSITVQLSYAAVTPGREAIIEALLGTWRYLTITATAVLALGWGGALLLEDRKQTYKDGLDSHVDQFEDTLGTRLLPLFEPSHPLRGVTHWDTLLRQFGTLLPGKDESARLLVEYLATKPLRHEGADCRSPSPNFPFSGMQGSQSLSKSEILAHLPSRDICDSLVRRYLATIEGTFRLFSIPSLLGEIEQCWANDFAVSFEWIAQFFMILAIGYDAMPKELQADMAQSPNINLRQIFLQMTEACLKKTLFMVQSNLTILRLLCLIVIVKQAGGFSCNEIDSCGTLTDMAVRSGMVLGLHRPVPVSRESILDRQIRARLWTTVVFLKVQQAINSGSRLLFHSADFDASALINLDDKDLESAVSIDTCGHPYSQYTESMCQILIAKSLPTAIEVVSHCNSSNDPLEPNQASLYEYEIRSLLQNMSQIYDSTCRESDLPWWKRLQRPMLETWFRRLLLIIHTPNPWNDSVFTLNRPYLESSLAILVQQRLLLEELECSATRMFAELFRQDFFVAALGACAVLRHGTTKASFLDSSWQEDTNPQVSPRETIIQALCWCREIWAREVDRSECNFWAHLTLQRLVESI